MKAAAVFPGKRTIEVIDIDEPGSPGDGEVKVRVLDVGICGTDREIARFEYGVPPEGSDYLIIGHEAAGEVVEIGSSVTELQTGDVVGLVVRHPCGQPECGPCRMGRSDFCVTGRFTESGIKQRHGFLRPYLIARPDHVVKAPAELRDFAVLAEPLTIAEKAFGEVRQILERLPWFPERERPEPLRALGDSRALVLGAGAVGLLGALRLRLAGYRTYVYSLEPAESVNARILQEAGCEYVSARDHEMPALPRIIGRIDLVYEATGVSTLAFGLMKYLGHNGMFILTGIPPLGKPIPLDADRIIRNVVLENQLIFGSVNAGREDHGRAMRTLQRIQAKWPKILPSTITAHHPIETLPDLLRAKPTGIKHVIHLR